MAGGIELRWGRVVGLFVGLAGAAVAGEATLRWRAPEDVERVFVEQRMGERNPMHPARNFFQLDPDIGFRPVLDSRDYDAHGVLRHDYALEKPAGITRVLFLGDSVVARGDLVGAIRGAYGEDGYEWWNGGVMGYSTEQELGYYRDHLDVDADRVVLGFHFSDFEVTPIMTLDEDGDLVVLNSRVGDLNPFLMRHSYLYRWWVARGHGDLGPGLVDTSVDDALEAAIVELDEVARERGAVLDILVLPLLVPTDQWPAEVRRRHSLIREIAQRHGIRHTDFWDVLDRAVEAGVELGSPPGDVMHPSPELSALMAEKLRSTAFLAAP